MAPSKMLALQLLLAIGILASTSLDAQQFRTGVQVVRTDVLVIDNRTGRPMTGLTAEDFTVKENGTQQRITSFVAEDGVAAGGRAELGETRRSNSAPRRSLLFIVPQTNRLATAEPYERLARFLRTQLRPDDLAAVMILNRVSAFTADGERLARLVERASHMPEALRAQLMRDTQLDYPPEAEAGIEAWLDPEGKSSLRNTTSLVLGTPEYIESFKHWDRMNRMVSSNPLLQVGAGIELLQRQGGERRIVLISLWGLWFPRVIGFPAIQDEYEEKALAARLTDSHVALDVVNTYGTMPGAGVMATISGQNLSRLSGGHFTSVRAVDEQLARLDEASTHGYIIGYVPTNSKLDGKYRQISITVNRKAVTVAYRRGYTARPEPSPVESRKLSTQARLQFAANAGRDLTDIRIQGVATAMSEPGRRVRVELTIYPGNLSLPQDDRTGGGVINLLILCVDSRGNIAGRVDQEMTLALDEAKYRHAIAAGIPYAVMVPVTSQPTYLKAIVYDYESDRLGSVRLRVN